MQITLKDYEQIKRSIRYQLEKSQEEVKNLFNGTRFDVEIYQAMPNEYRKTYSQLVHIMDNLKGQLDAFKILEGDENTEISKLLRWKNNS